MGHRRRPVESRYLFSVSNERNRHADDFYHGARPYTNKVSSLDGGTFHRDIPIQDQDPLDGRTHLHDLGGDGDVVEEAKTHVFVGLRVMTRGSNDRKCLLHFTTSHSKAGLYHATGTELSCIWRGLVNVKRQVVVVRFGIRDVLGGKR